METLRKELMILGVRTVKIRYSGSGDNGAVDEKEFLDKFGREVDITESTNTGHIDDLTKYIDGDWYNNDGGQGVITWDLKTNKLRISAEYNIMEVNSEEQRIDLNNPAPTGDS